MKLKINKKHLYRGLGGIFVAAFAVFVGFIAVPAADADELEEVNEKIEALQSQIDGFEKEATELHKQVNTLQNQIAILQNEQESLRKRISLKEAEHAKLELDIKSTQKRIDDNNESIGYAIAQYYYSEETSTLERLASTGSFSEFIDTEVNISSKADTLMEIVRENKALKEDLVEKKLAAEQVLQDLNVQKNELAAKQQEQANLLAQTQSDEQKYQEMKSAAESEKSDLRKRQQELIAAQNVQYGVTGTVTAGDPSKGGYPYSGVCPQYQDAYADPWGMYICECVSYAAWKVQQAYGNMPYWGGIGNANQWPGNARAMGFTVSNVPKAGTVGIMMSGYYGHAVWVEDVSADGSQVYISQYNALNAATGYVWGEYSEQWMGAGAYVYIYFGG